jgi:hypothetical protein
LQKYGFTRLVQDAHPHKTIEGKALRTILNGGEEIKMNIRRLMIVAAAGLAVALCVPAVAEDHNDHDRARYEHRDRDHDRDHRNWERQHQRDRDHDRWRDDHSRDERWRQDHRWRDDHYGYRDGDHGRAYNPYYGNGNYPYYGNGNYRPSGYYGRNGSAGNIGYQDGVNDGAKDRQTGHSFRPTQDDNYKHASRGYNSSMGNRQQYANAYRQTYERGYQQGYNGGGSRY